MKKDWTENFMAKRLQERDRKGTLRRLTAADSSTDTTTTTTALIDFSSNDYLGLARCPEQAERVEERFHAQQQQQQPVAILGATGSRLLSGDSYAFHRLEEYLATVHGQPSALLCNSGYDANLSVVSSLPCDVVIYDSLAHNSLHMGMRLWQSRPQTHPQQHRQAIPFVHNSVSDLEHKLLGVNSDGGDDDCSSRSGNKRVVIIVESVYSMDGDCAPLAEILKLAKSYNAKVVVDEAHGLGALGPTGLLGRLGLQQHSSLFATIYTFGKAAGCHGAVITGSPTLKSYLINFAFPFIYSTALPLHSLCTIRVAYETMTSAKGGVLRQQLEQMIEIFQKQLQSGIARLRTDISLIPSTTAIQALVVPGNKRCSDFCHALWERSKHRIRLFPIKSPTVPSGMERVRIVLHSHNTTEQVLELIDLLLETIRLHSAHQGRIRAML